MACGNEGAGDDAAGVMLLERLRASCGHAARFVRVVEFGIEAMDLFAANEVVVLLDAVESGAEPGTIHFLPAVTGDARNASRLGVSAHGWGLAGVLALAHALGRPAPRIVVAGIELASVAPDENLSPPVRRAVERLAASFPAWLEALCRLGGRASYAPGEPWPFAAAPEVTPVASSEP